MNILRDPDIDPAPLRSHRIAIIGFGSQGRAQALNLRDGGYDVRVGLRPGRPSWAAATAAGLRVQPVAEAVRTSSVVMLLVPDETQPAVFAADVAPHLGPESYLGFAHGFAVHYRRIVPPAGLGVFLVSPHGIGPQVRAQFVAGSGVPCLVAVQQDATGQTRRLALAYAAAIGGGRAGVFETTFREETETDLFAEQAVLCGGLPELLATAYETLTDAGYPPEMAYFACVHEVKFIVDLLHTEGLMGMRARTSTMAQYGGLTRGPRVVGAAVRAALRAVLDDIRGGVFADEWAAEHARGAPRLAELVRAQSQRGIEDVGRKLRALLAAGGGPRGPESAAPR